MAAQAGADGILVTPGILEQVIEVVDRLAIILRIDGCVSTSGSGAMRLFSSVEHAATLGVDGVVVNATIGALYESDELEKVGRVSTEGRRCGVPVVAEMLTQRMMANHMDFSGSGETLLPPDLHDDVAMACRIGVELGADAIKPVSATAPFSTQHTLGSDEGVARRSSSAIEPAVVRRPPPAGRCHVGPFPLSQISPYE